MTYAIPMLAGAIVGAVVLSFAGMALTGALIGLCVGLFVCLFDRGNDQ